MPDGRSKNIGVDNAGCRCDEFIQRGGPPPPQDVLFSFADYTILIIPYGPLSIFSIVTTLSDAVHRMPLFYLNLD
ncbi:hypothetical protein D3OALGA1CA_1200 [Olavius algarvensis associated proteobacterium Delta 3]|nr:hypothetical protein D3OALGA1CA_1200 [Olavius algarvensis associated proteobacterium Delta 3]CAB5107794.1 hypothetical protein D3OALGB2SA_2239 [Olavius algarvensis associated proteobacterium Delta 3]